MWVAAVGLGRDCLLGAGEPHLTGERVNGQALSLHGRRFRGAALPAYATPVVVVPPRVICTR
jgi:hypothetical protein